MRPTKEQLANILIHAAFLEALPPPETNKFNMNVYGAVNDGVDEDGDAQFHDNEDFEEFDSDTPLQFKSSKVPDCGFSACALGWGPLNPDLPIPQVGESWSGYSKRVFGIDEYNPNTPFNDEMLNAWTYCFQSHWAEDEFAAAERLRDVHAYHTA